MAKTIPIHVKTTAELKALRQAEVAVDNVGDTVQVTNNQLLKAQKNMRRMNTEVRGLGVGSRNSARGILEISRAFEDLQFGLRGVLNNIPGILQSFGVGAGVAGVVSIAAVSVDALRRRFSGLGEGSKKASDEMSKAFTNMEEGLERLAKRWDQVEESAKGALDRQKEITGAEEDLRKARAEAEQERIKSLDLPKLDEEEELIRARGRAAREASRSRQEALAREPDEDSIRLERLRGQRAEAQRRLDASRAEARRVRAAEERLEQLEQERARARRDPTAQGAIRERALTEEIDQLSEEIEEDSTAFLEAGAAAALAIKRLDKEILEASEDFAAALTAFEQKIAAERTRLSTFISEEERALVQVEEARRLLLEQEQEVIAKIGEEERKEAEKRRKEQEKRRRDEEKRAEANLQERSRIAGQGLGTAADIVEELPLGREERGALEARIEQLRNLLRTPGNQENEILAAIKVMEQVFTQALNANAAVNSRLTALADTVKKQGNQALKQQ